MPNDIEVFLNTDFYGVPVWGIIMVAILGAFIFFILLKLTEGKKKDEPFKPIDIQKALQDNITHMTNIFMKYIDKPLVSNLNTLAHIYSGMPIYWNDQKDLKENLMESMKIANNKEEFKGKTFYLLKISKPGIFNKALGKFLNYGKTFILVDNDLLTFYPKEVILKSTITPSPPYFGITIFSDEGKEYVESIVWKIANEQFMGEVVNYIKKQTYIETHQAKTMEELDGMTKLRKEAKKDAIEELTGAKKK